MQTNENSPQSKQLVFQAIRKVGSDTFSPNQSSPLGLHSEKLKAFSSRDQHQLILRVTEVDLLKEAVLMNSAFRYLRGVDRVQVLHLLYICRGFFLFGWAAPAGHQKQVFCHARNDSFLILAPFLCSSDYPDSSVKICPGFVIPGGGSARQSQAPLLDVTYCRFLNQSRATRIGQLWCR